MEKLLACLESWRPFRALVVGDFMLDELVFGDAERLSADAPVPVLHVRRIERRPGGAANLCLNLAALGAQVEGVGAAGDDEAGDALAAALRDAGVGVAGIVRDPARPTTLKRSLIGLAQQRHPQKMFRVDYESRDPVPDALGERLLAAFRDALARVDIVCVEDYAKGVCADALCARMIDEARRAGRPVLVDPARIADYRRYRGCTAITPNRNEAEYATGLGASVAGDPGHNAALAERLLRELACEAVVLTLDRHGALLLHRGGEPIAAPTRARRVYDVTGAGDMFLAGLAAGRANALDWPDAVHLANIAAGLEVEVFGVEPIPLARLHAQVLAESGRATPKLRTHEQLLDDVRAWRGEGKRIVLTNGCFDVLHAGHVWLLDRARSLGDILIVATNTDERIREFKGPGRPVNTLTDRARVLAGLASVDAVVAFSEETPLELIHTLRPDVLAKGDEYPIERIPGAAFVASYGGRVERIPMLAGLGSTEILRRLGDERAAKAASAETHDRFTKDRR